MPGLAGEFGSAAELVAAARALRARGFPLEDALSPYPVRELEEPLLVRRPTIPRWTLVAGLVGVALAYGIIAWCNAVDYPLDVGGRPLDSLPADVPIIFETTVLFASLTAFTLALTQSSLPRLWAPVFEIEGIERATIDRFWLLVADDGSAAREALAAQGAWRVVAYGGGS